MADPVLPPESPTSDGAGTAAPIAPPVSAAAPAGSTAAAAADAPDASDAAVSAASSLMSRFDTAGRMIFGGGVVAIVAILLGVVVKAWGFGGFAIVGLLAALVAIAVAYLSSPITVTDGWSVPGRDLALLAGVVLSVLAVLQLIAAVFDLDQLDGAGDWIGFILTVVLTVASFMVLLGAQRAHKMRAIASAAVRGGDRGTRIALAGLALDLVAWLFMLTVSYWALGNTPSFGIGASVLAVLILLVGGNPDHPWRLPIPASWISVGLSLVTAFFLLELFNGFGSLGRRVELGLIDTLAFYAHVLAVLVILAGSVLSAVDHQRRVAAAKSTTTPTGGGAA